MKALSHLCPTPTCLAAPWQVLWLLACMAALVAVAGGARADEIQILRRGGSDIPEAQGGVMPFTTFQAEKLAVTQKLPCKWLSTGGRVGPSYGNAYYDFLCKGGDWATVSLYLNKASRAPAGVGSVLLLYRDWGSDVHPNAGEASVAQAFLAHVVNRFVPASKGPDVLDTFWRKNNKTWASGGVKITFRAEQGDGFWVHRLEVVGTEKAIVTPQQAATDVAKARETGLSKPPVATKAPQPDVIVIQPVPSPVVPRVNIPHGAAPAPVALPQPQKGLGEEVALPHTSGLLTVPASTPAGGKGTVLASATEAELNTAPAPESKAKPTPPPAVSSSLVPDADMLVYGRAKAPANFDIYNKAEALTRSEEQRAFGKSSPDKVKPTVPQNAAGLAKSGGMKAPSEVSGTALKALPSPAAVSASLVATGGLATAPSESRTAPNTAPVAPSPTSVAPGNEEASSLKDIRPLPQLKFVPKAEPLKNPAEVLTFEDEKSKL